MPKVLKRFGAIVALLSTAVLAGCEPASQATAQQEALPPPAVTVFKVVPKELGTSIAFTARVEAMDKVELRARVDGFLEQRLFQEGSNVKKGDLLFVIEKAPYLAAVADAQGALQSAQAALTRAGQEYERQLSLTKSNVSAQTRLEDAISSRDQASGNLAQLKAKLERAQLELGYTDIYAPIDGRIGRSLLSVGNFVGPSSGVLSTIVSQDPVHVSFSVTQREILNLCRKDGKSNCSSDTVVRLRLADDSFYTHTGKIDFVDVTVNQGTDAVRVRATFPNPERALADGQLVSAIVQSAKPQMQLVIPQAAIQVDQSGTFVLAVTSDNKIEVRRVELGTADGSGYAVTKGLVEGDLVLTEGVQKVRPGQVVQPSPAAPGA
jgi:membrane fusion protein (multidrug efflux system)